MNAQWHSGPLRLQLSEEYGFLIIADEVYQLLCFPQSNPPPPMFTFDKHGTVLALGSFSKILAPALRLGWIQGSPHLLKRIFDCGQLDSSGGINPVISGIVHSAIDLGLLVTDTHLLQRTKPPPLQICFLLFPVVDCQVSAVSVGSSWQTFVSDSRPTACRIRGLLPESDSWLHLPHVVS